MNWFYPGSICMHYYTPHQLMARFIAAVHLLPMPLRPCTSIYYNIFNRQFKFLQNTIQKRCTTITSCPYSIFNNTLQLKWVGCLQPNKPTLCNSMCISANTVHLKHYLLGGSGGSGLSCIEGRRGEFRGEFRGDWWWWGNLPPEERELMGWGGWPNCWRRSEPDLTCMCVCV